MSTQCTANPSPDDRKRAVVRADLEHQTFHVEPPSPHIEAMLQTVQHVYREQPTAGFRLAGKPQPLIGTSSTVPHGGLASVVGYLLLCEGYDVEVIGPHVRPLEQLSVLEGGQGAHNPHVIKFICDVTHGIIRHNLSAADVDRVCVEIASNLPRARIAFVSSQLARAEQLRSALEAPGLQVLFATAGRCENAETRVAVVTPTGLAHREVIPDPFDVLVFLDAAQVATERSQLAVLASGRARIFGFAAVRQFPALRIRHLMMAAFGPEEITIPCFGYRSCDTEVASIKITGGRPIRDSLTGAKLNRTGIVKNAVRNRRVAKLARALVEHNSEILESMCPCVAEVVQGACATVVVCDNVEHAFELASMLPTWRIVLGEDELAGLSGEQQQAIDSVPYDPFSTPKAIVTVAGLRSMDLSDFGAVVWAAGGMGMPTSAIVLPICQPDQPRRLLWIDCDDRFQQQLHRASRVRRQDYVDNGWFDVGRNAVVCRIEQFLNDLSRGQR